MSATLSNNVPTEELERIYASMTGKPNDGMRLKNSAYNTDYIFPGSPWRPSSFPTPNEVRTEAESMSSQILSDWRKLQKIVELHHEVISKRWMKKTRTRQKETLLRAWPNMSPGHRPDWEALRQERTGRMVISEISANPEAYMWPYINLEDLSSKSLLIFIESRGRNPPSAFARSDVKAMHLASVAHTVKEPCLLDEHALYLDGDTVETYGKLVPFAEDPEAKELMYTSRQFTPGEGLRAFELQQRIYPFLIKVCELILHDMVEAATLYDTPTKDEKSKVIPEMAKLEISSNVPPAPTEGGFLPTLHQIAAEAPYRLPASLDFHRIREVIAGKRSASDDHVWALREDPGYFGETVTDWGEHRNDRLLDYFGNPHPTGPHTMDFWERVVRNIIHDAYSNFMTWDLLLRLVDRLIVLQAKYKDQIAYEKRLPKEYLIELLKFRQILQVSCETPIFKLRNIQSSPPLREYFYRDPQTPGTVMMSIQPKNPKDPHFHKPWGLLLFMWEPAQRNLLGLANIVDAFEHLMQDPKEKKNMSPYMLDVFSDLSVFTRCLHEVDNYQPWGASLDEEELKYKREVEAIAFELKYQIEYTDQMDHVLRTPEILTPFAMPDQKRFFYPVNKRRTKQTTEAMMQAELNLDIFWRKYDANWKANARKTHEASMGDHISAYKGKQLTRTAPWVEPVKEGKKDDHADDDDADFKQAEDKTTTKKKVPERKHKIKTKGVAHPTDDTLSAPTNTSKTQETSQEPTSKYELNTRGLKVINALFYVPNQNDPPGEIIWGDFLQVMATAGFAIQKLYGSIWQFSPSSDKVSPQRSIQFHEPHPGVKIPFIHARRMGRRLMRAYGWNGGMFEGS
ncbi:hypothetical protein HYFRA_00001466 [Hymenoscyphus fraxineus]|uniref:Uncharacterized protein n=1 Tax=Hymenoscyphus fraxineus TaxID=746836 RepID=A0A9N9L8B7_9HELO|nr:hypothetical protein HYFRA_00001466 [Hymenoscyphus fraxineus]